MRTIAVLTSLLISGVAYAGEVVWSANLPDDAAEIMRAVYKNGFVVTCYTESPVGGYVIVTEQHGISVCIAKNVPADMSKTLRRHEHQVKWASFNDRGGWAVFYGTNGYASDGLSAPLLRVLRKAKNDGHSFQTLTFWQGKDDYFFVTDKSMWWSDIPMHMRRKVNEISETSNIEQLGCASDGSWYIIFDECGYQFSEGIPARLESRVARANRNGDPINCILFSQHKETWVLSTRSQRTGNRPHHQPTGNFLDGPLFSDFEKQLAENQNRSNRLRGQPTGNVLESPIFANVEKQLAETQKNLENIWSEIAKTNPGLAGELKARHIRAMSEALSDNYSELGNPD